MKPKSPNIALIDADFLMFKCTGTKRIVTDEIEGTVEKSLEEVINSANSWIAEIMTKTDSEYYIGALTLPGCFRYGFNPDYKKNRRSKEKPKYFSELRLYLQEYKKFIFHPGLEADDIVNIIRWNIRGYNLIIVSEDTDLLSLEGTHYNPVKKVFVTTTEDEAHLKFWRDMIIGQHGDGIKGLPGSGEVFVDKLFSIENIGIPYHQLVLTAYIAKLGEEKGIDSFYSTFKSLKILDSYEGFNIPEPIKYEVVLPT